MKNKKIILIISVILLMFAISTVNASDADINQTNVLSLDNGNHHDVLTINQKSIYVDDINGADSNEGYSKDSSLKTISKAFSKANNNDTIYLSDGVYSGLKNTKLTISKSVNIIGDKNTVIDGENQNYIFIIKDNVKVTLKNIKFVNSYKAPTSISNTYDGEVYGAALEIKKATVNIDNCSFINNCLSYGNSYIYGGAISNFGDLTITDSYFENNTAFSTSGLFSYGGSIYNNGKLSIDNTVFDKSKSVDFGYGAGIANDGELSLTNSLITNSHATRETKGSAIYNTGNIIILNSIIENNYIEQSNFRFIYGAVYNSGNLTARGTIFRNNTAFYEKNKQDYIGSPNIYNSGNLNLTYNAFTDNSAYKGIYSDVYFNAGEAISLDNNWWSTNENPYEAGSIINNENVNTWLTLKIAPEYSMVNISDFTRIIVSWSNNLNQVPELSLFPSLYVTFETSTGQKLTREFVNGKTSYKFSYTQNKGQYYMTITSGSFSKEVVIDVGKKATSLNVVSNNNIIFNETLKINISLAGEDNKIVNGAVLVEYDQQTYEINLTNGKANLEINNLKPGKYTLKVTYEGNDNYFKSFYNKKITIKKQTVDLYLSTPDVKIGENGVAIATLMPKGVQGQAILYINGERKKIVYLYNGNTSIPLKNFADGKYDVKLQFVETNKYYEKNVTSTFNVNRYDSSMKVTAKSIKVGSDAIINIKTTPDGLMGEAILIVNDYNETIYLEASSTNVTLSNLKAGRYNVTVLYDGHSKFYPVKASTSFNVLKTASKLNVVVTQNDKDYNGTITVKTSPKACTGAVGVYINYRHYSLNLTNGVAKFNVEFDKGSNLIFVYYEGDDFYRDSNWNTTIGVVDKFIFLGKNSTGWNYNDFDYAVRLVEENGVPIKDAVVTVKLLDKQYKITTDDGGFAYLTLNLPTGKYNVTSTYNRVTIQNTLTVNDIKFTLSTKDIVYGDDELIEASFENGITGKVNFVISGFLNETVDIVDGKAVYNMSNLRAKNYVVKATYLNDKYTSGIVKSSFVVSKADLNLNVTCTGLSSKTNTVITVSNLERATGKIIFNVNGNEYTKTIKNSQCILTLPKLTAGKYDLTIQYAGNVNYTGVTYNTAFYISEYSTTIRVKANNAVYGRNVAVTATLNENATGIVRFAVENLTYDAKIKNGVASWKFSWIDVGTHTINATYLGDNYYASSSNSTSVIISKAKSSMVLFTQEVLLNENIRIYASLSNYATGQVLFSMDGYYSPRYKPIREASSMWYISPLNTGKYTVIAQYDGDKNYYGCNATLILKITQQRSVFKVEVDDVGTNDKVVANIQLKTIDGVGISDYIDLKIASKSYSIFVDDGEATFVMGKLSEGTYSFEANYYGNAEFSKASCSGTFEVSDSLLDVVLTAKDVEKYYSGSEKLEISLLTAKGKPVVGETVKIRINKVDYEAVTDKNGRASIPLNMNSGNYTAVIKFEETDMYHAASTRASVTILRTVEGIDLNKLYGSGNQYFAIFSDSKGKVLANTDVKFTIGDKSITVKTMANGIARLNINIDQGVYQISTVNPVTGEANTNRLFVFNYLMVNKDVTKYYHDSNYYKVRAFDVNGKPAVGVTVKMEVDGKTYNIQTDDKGFAYLTVDLKPGSYTVKATYNKYTVTNKITVKS
ncbi:hypothetical protein TL18_03910 [Methanobrevibacter sp. YE315]|uniref:Ig-like domain repeat protein n=1 Tax=Methanobrevibacter sp. YE315 TaxID=1609968 RepID=UPI000764EBAB|nr:Ig-like domain repeat protein [Methanobrevibacter sp. YE315]AMD17241.1 hypothetical protein TL18_03910 [Methanobrevibacter sp. YE315]